jgi:hypothetical protein
MTPVGRDYHLDPIPPSLELVIYKLIDREDSWVTDD